MELIYGLVVLYLSSTLSFFQYDLQNSPQNTKPETNLFFRQVEQRFGDQLFENNWFY